MSTFRKKFETKALENNFFRDFHFVQSTDRPLKNAIKKKLIVNFSILQIGQKPIKESHFPSETTATTLSAFALSQLRECDHIANKILEEEGVSKNISQMPVILLPLHFDREPYSQKVGSCQRKLSQTDFD